MTRVLNVVLALSLLAVGCGGDDDDDVIDAAGNPDTGGNIDSGGGPTTFNLTLTTADEVPVCASAGAAAAGTATITISEDETMIMAEITYSGLSGAATAAHIHGSAPSDMTAPAILPFANLTSPITQTFTAADYPQPAPAGAPADFAGAVAAMKAGMTYLNVHTDMCMPGEIRAQID